MRSLAWAFLFLAVSVSCTKISFRRVESNRQGQLRRVGSPSLRQKGLLKKQDYSVDYIGEIQIGTPPQSFAVQLDPGSSLLWVLDSSYHYCHGFECAVQLQPCPSYCRDKVFCKALCEQSCCNGKGAIKSTFKSSASSTYQKNGSDFDMVGLDIEGFYGIDTIQIGNSPSVTLKQAYFGQTDFLMNFDYTPADGVLGLLDEVPDYETDKLKPFIQQLVDGGALSQPIFSVFMSSETKPEVAGAITYGDFDDEHCLRPTIYMNMTKGYAFTASSVIIGSTTFLPVKSDSVYISSIFTEESLTVPHQQIDAVAKLFNAVPDRTTSMYHVDCDAKLPSIAISFGTDALKIPADSLRSQTPDDSGLCELRIISFSDFEQWTFGSVLTRSYCQVFDIGNKRIGFGKVKSSTS